MWEVALIRCFLGLLSLCLIYIIIKCYSYPGDVVLTVNLDEISVRVLLVLLFVTRSIRIRYETASCLSRSYGSIGRSTFHTTLEGSRINEDTADRVFFASWKLELWQFL